MHFLNEKEHHACSQTGWLYEKSQVHKDQLNIPSFMMVLICFSALGPERPDIIKGIINCEIDMQWCDLI